MNEMSRLSVSSHGSQVSLDKNIEMRFFQQPEDTSKKRKLNLSRAPKLKAINLDLVCEINSTGKEPSVIEELEEEDQTVKVDLYDIKKCRDLFSKVAE